MTFLTPVIDKVNELIAPFHPQYLLDDYLLISIPEQTLFHINQSKVMASYVVSTALKGGGCAEGSEKTPLGVHRIAEKIGDEVLKGSLFKARQNTQEIIKTLNKKGEFSDIDAITSRILWLDGLELGKNKGANVDSYHRYIYIHGTNEEWRLGSPASHGCIRMSNQEIIDLYDTVCVNTLVVIIN